MPLTTCSCCWKCAVHENNKISTSTTFDLVSIQQLVSLLDQYQNSRDEKAPEEFIKESVCSQQLFIEYSKEIIVYLFLKICNFKKFITTLLEEANIPINTHTIGKVLSFISHLNITTQMLKN